MRRAKRQRTAERTASREALFERARGAVPGRRELAGAGVQGGGRARRCSSRAAQGAYVWDVDGNRYVDFMGSWGPLILGHADPDVLEAIRAAAADGTTFGASTEREIALGEELRAACPVAGADAAGLLGHRGDHVGAAAGARVHRAAQDRQDRGRLPRARRHAAGGRRLGRGHPGHPRLGRRHRARRWPTRCWSPGTTRRRCAPRWRPTAGEVAAVIVEPVPGNMGLVPPRAGLPAGAARAVRRARRPADLRRGDHRLPRGARAAPRRSTASGPTSPAWARSPAAACRWASTAGGPTSWRRSRPTGPSTRRARCRGTRWRWRPGWPPCAS